MDGLCLDFSHKTIQIMWINVHEALLLLSQVNALSNKILSYNQEYMLLLQRGGGPESAPTIAAQTKVTKELGKQKCVGSK